MYLLEIRNIYYIKNNKYKLFYMYLFGLKMSYDLFH
jgi:hypothetical protein